MRASSTTASVVLCLALGIGFLALGGTAQADLLTNLQGYWAFDETSGTTAFDTYTTGVNLGLQGDTTENWTTGGALGGGFNFAGNQYFQSPTNGDVPLANKSFTVQYWGKRSISNHEAWAIGHSNDGNNKSLHIGHRGGADQNFAFWGNDMGWGVAEANDQSAFHHWAFVYDTAANTRTIYLDGGTAAGGSQSTQTGVGTDFQGTELFQVGARNYDAGSSYHGIMDEVGVWGRPLTAAEVSDLYNGGTPLNFFMSVDNDLVWNGPSGNWNASNWTGGASGEFPEIIGTEGDTATILAGSVTVAADRGAYSVDVTGGSLTIGNGGKLSLLKEINVATALTIGNDAKLVTPSGSLVAVNTAGNATIENSGDVTASHLTMATNNTFTKAGNGVLSFDQSAGNNSMDGTNTIAVTGGELKMQVAAAPNPLGGAGLNLDGGTFTVQGVLGILNNALEHRGFLENNDGQVCDLNNNGGMMSDPLRPSHYATVLLTNGPGNRGLNFDNDQDFMTAGAIEQDHWNDYSNLFVGMFNAPETGNYVFRPWERDDPVGMWIDLDQDGVFESSTPGLGNNRGEQLSWNHRRGEYTVALQAGEKYMVGYTHREGGGGSQIDIQFKTPSEDWRTIMPADAAQDGLWSVESISAIEMSNTAVTVSADSTLNAITDSTASFGALSFDANDKTLTTSGAAGGMSFTGTTFGPGVSVAGINTGTDTLLGTINDGGVGVTINKSGAAALILDQTSTSIDSTTFNMQGGTLALTIGSGTAGDGGTETFDTAVNVTANSNLTAGQHANGLTGPKTVVLGSVANPLTISSGTLAVSTTDQYTLDFAGAISGSGGLQLKDGSSLTFTGGGGTVGTLILEGDQVGALASLAASNAYHFNPTAATPTMTVGIDVGGGTEVYIGSNDVVDGLVILTGNNTYTDFTRIQRSVLQVGDVANLAPANLQLNGNNRDQVTVLEAHGSFTRNIGTGAGEMQWRDQGGFSAQGGDLTVNLFGDGREIVWNNNTANGGFNSRDSIQFGSRSADGVVIFENDINMGNRNPARFQVSDNPDTNADAVRFTGVITDDGGDTGRLLRFNESTGNSYTPQLNGNWRTVTAPLIELLGTNTYNRETFIDLGVVYAIEGVGLPVDSQIHFDANNWEGETIFMSNGTMNRNIGNGAGEVKWDHNGGGFAARGGTFDVTLEGGNALDWGNGDTGFNGNDKRLMLGSTYADNVVTLHNDIFSTVTNRDRYIALFGNPDVDTDWAVIDGNITVGRDLNIHYRGNEIRKNGARLDMGTAADPKTITTSRNLNIRDGAVLNYYTDMTTVSNELNVTGGASAHIRGNVTTGGRIVSQNGGRLEIDGDVTWGNYMETRYWDQIDGSTGSELIVHGNAISNARFYSNEGGTTTIDGFMNIGTADVQTRGGSTLTIGGPLTMGNVLEIHNDSVVTIGGELNNAGRIYMQHGGSSLTVDGNATMGGNVQSRQGSTLTIKGNLTMTDVYENHDASTVIITGDLNNTGRIYSRHAGTSFTVGGNATMGTQVDNHNGAIMTIGGNLTAGNYVYMNNDVNNTMIVGGDLTVNGTNDDAIRVEAGSMTVGGNTTAHRINFESDARFTAGGTVTVADELDMEGGSIISPGIGVGAMHVVATGEDQRLWMHGNTRYEWELGGSGGVAGTDYDTIAIDGNLQLDDTWTLALHDLGGEAAEWDPLALFTGFTNVTWDPAAVSFDMTDAPAWLEFTQPEDLRVEHLLAGAQGPEGLYLLGLQTVPEPSTIVLMLLGGLGLLAVARRRRK